MNLAVELGLPPDAGFVGGGFLEVGSVLLDSFQQCLSLGLVISPPLLSLLLESGGDFEISLLFLLESFGLGRDFPFGLHKSTKLYY